MKIIKKVFINFLLIFMMISLIKIGTVNAATSVDDTMNAAESFIRSGEQSTNINETELQDTADFLYNLLLGIGIIVAVIVGMVIGIKFMTGGIEEKAEYKQLLLPYLVSCAVVFGAFGIWKIAVNVLSEL